MSFIKAVMVEDTIEEVGTFFTKYVHKDKFYDITINIYEIKSVVDYEHKRCRVHLGNKFLTIDEPYEYFIKRLGRAIVEKDTL